MNAQEREQLHADMAALYVSTQEPKWDGASAKPIGMRNWNEALVSAVFVDENVHGLPVPTPGADPGGFVWLTWATESRRFALSLTTSLVDKKYRWTRTVYGIESSYEADSWRDVIESMRSTFAESN